MSHSLPTSLFPRGPGPPGPGQLWRASAALRRAAAAGTADLAAATAGHLEGLPSRLALIAGSILPQLIEPCSVPALAAAGSLRATDGCRILSREPAAGLAARELADKGSVFGLVLAAGPLIGTPSESFPLPLRRLLHRAYGLGDYPALWVVEGLGHDYTDSFWRQGLVPRGLFTGARGAALPAKALPMLHAGLGLSLAEHLLRELPSGAPAAAVRRTVGRFLHLAEDNSRPGYLGATLESLGLVTRLFFPPKVAAVASALRDLAPEASDFFWHGLGRAIYFSPINFLPFSIHQAFTMAVRETPSRRARRNAVAGVAWALTLVTERHPEVMAELFLAPYGGELRREDGFSSGVASTICMREVTTPGAAFNLAYPAFRPADPGVQALWRRWIGEPASWGLEVELPALRREGRLGELFRFRPAPGGRW